MSLVEVRQEIVDRLEELDENMLMAIHTIVHNSASKQEEEVVGYESDGTPINLKTLRTDAAEGIKEIQEGKGITAEEVNKDVEAWLHSIE